MSLVSAPSETGARAESLILGQPFRGCELAQSNKLCTNKDGDKMSLSIRSSLMLSLSGIRRKKYRRREVGAGEKAGNQRPRERLVSHVNAEPWRGAGYWQYLFTARLPQPPQPCSDSSCLQLSASVSLNHRPSFQNLQQAGRTGELAPLRSSPQPMAHVPLSLGSLMLSCVLHHFLEFPYELKLQSPTAIVT